MLLSITSEQNMRPEFASDVPTNAEMVKLERVVPTMGLDETLEYAKTIIPDEVALSLFNLPLKLEIVEHPGFHAHLVTCDRCVVRPVVERSTPLRPVRVGVGQGGASACPCCTYAGDLVKGRSGCGGVEPV
jgi:hypothetical protein